MAKVQSRIPCQSYSERGDVFDRWTDNVNDRHE